MPTPDALILPNINPIPRRKPHRFGPDKKLRYPAGLSSR